MIRASALILCLVLASSASAASRPGVLQWDLQLFTGPSTLACPTPDDLSLAYNARDRGWTYAPSAGVDGPPGLRPGDPVSPSTFGCTVYDEGVQIQLAERTFATGRSNLGWLELNDVRNAPEVYARAKQASEQASRQASRPTLCGAHGCVYTDVHPYERVR